MSFDIVPPPGPVRTGKLVQQEEGVSPSNLIGPVVQMGQKRSAAVLHNDAMPFTALELGLVLASRNKRCPADVETWTMCQFKFFTKG